MSILENRERGLSRGHHGVLSTLLWRWEYRERKIMCFISRPCMPVTFPRALYRSDTMPQLQNAIASRWTMRGQANEARVVLAVHTNQKSDGVSRCAAVYPKPLSATDWVARLWGVLIITLAAGMLEGGWSRIYHHEPDLWQAHNAAVCGNGAPCCTHTVLLTSCTALEHGLGVRRRGLSQDAQTCRGDTLRIFLVL